MSIYELHLQFAIKDSNSLNDQYNNCFKQTHFIDLNCVYYLNFNWNFNNFLTITIIIININLYSINHLCDYFKFDYSYSNFEKLKKKIY
jgi:hypothetical protein